MRRWIIIGLTIVTLITIAFFVAAIWSPEFRAIARDIAIIILALFQMITAIIGIVLLVALLFIGFQIQKVARQTVIPQIGVLTGKVDEILETTKSIAGTAQATTQNVSQTTNYVSKQVVSPFVKAAGLVAGVKAAAEYIARRDDP
jgi:uncharacterized membrane protein